MTGSNNNGIGYETWYKSLSQAAVRATDAKMEANKKIISRKLTEDEDRRMKDKYFDESHSAEELVEAVRAMSAEKTGALIVLQHKGSMEEYMATGDRFEADINRRLIMQIPG